MTANVTTAPKDHSQIIVDGHNMITANKVEVSQVSAGKRAVAAHVVINDGELIHTFKPESRVSKSLQVTPADALAERLTGGKFFTINDTLVDFRDNQYNGFVHSTDSIQKLIETIGVSEINKQSRGVKFETTQGNLILSNVWGSEPLEIAEYKDGGAFNSRLRYNWSPFSQSIRGVFELVRMICTNGMVGLTDFFNAKIPMINRWDEHMDIAYTQIQNKVQGRVKHRILEMGKERATVGELMQIADHAATRLKQIQLFEMGERQRLSNIAEIANPKIHLRDVYRQGVFEDKAIANRVAGHLTAFDAWNLVTEMYSHTHSSNDSSDIGLQRMANSLLFDGEQRAKRLLNVGHTTHVASSFSSPETAFFGTMQ